MYLCFVIAKIEVNGRTFSANLKAGMDISLSFGPNGDNPNAFGIPSAEIQAIQVGDFVGSVAKGSGANCDIIRFCAHGNATHTECLGHITAAHENVGDCIKDAFVLVDLITVELSSVKMENILMPENFPALPKNGAEAIAIRSLPNGLDKKSRNWSGANAPFFSKEAMVMLVNQGYTHLLTDFPSVDPEEDDGALAAHHIWWNVPAHPRKNASITELIYVPNDIPDGLYLLNLQFSNIQSDASPSKPVLFRLEA